MINPRSEPDSGNPTVRDRRGAQGNVVLLRRDARALHLSRPKIRAHSVVGANPTE